MPAGKQNIYLIGPMGSGKTTIGRRLAEKLGLTFYDCDHEIETRTGASVTLIFEIEGEVGFRERERQMLLELARREGVLVATGGGAVLTEANRNVMRQSGTVVCLRTSVVQQLERLGRDRSRPLLRTTNRKEKLMELAETRNPLYEKTADIVFPVKNRNIESTVSQIYQAICSYRGAPTGGPGDPHIASSET